MSTTKNPKKPKAPNHLAATGRRLWREVNADYSLDVAELRLLEHLCRTEDRIDEITVFMRDQPLMITGSMKQMVDHPMLTQLRAQQAHAAKLWVQLNLPKDDSGAGALSTAARSMAAKRHLVRVG